MLRLLTIILMLGATAGVVWADADVRPNQGPSCPSIYSNTTLVHTRFADLTEVFDDLHTVAAQSGPICGFEIWLRNSSPTTTIVAEVAFYDNSAGDPPPTDRIGGPHRISLPPGHQGPVYVQTTQGDVRPHMWVGVSFPQVPDDGRGFVGVVVGPAENGNSHDILYSGQSSTYLDFDDRNADIHIQVYSNVPRTTEDSTWGRVKGVYR
jgi:hypothetical protein